MTMIDLDAVIAGDALKPCPNPKCVNGKPPIYYEGDDRCAPFVKCGNKPNCCMVTGSIAEWNNWPRALPTSNARIEAGDALRLISQGLNRYGQTAGRSELISMAIEALDTAAIVGGA